MTLKTAPLTPADIDQADRVFRIAFGTRNGLANPIQFDGDAARIRTRCLSRHVIALGCWDNGSLIAVSLGTAWGTFGWIGPLAVHPDYWNGGIGQQLLEPTIKKLQRHGSRHLALFTLGESPKHVALYHKFGFWPGFLILIGHKSIENPSSQIYRTFTHATENEKRAYLAACKEITFSIHQGLDLTDEIEELQHQALGEVVFVQDQGKMAGFAICHIGPGTEAPSGTAQIKFAAIRPGLRAQENFENLLSACEDLVFQRGLNNLNAGINTARRAVYAAMMKRGFKVVQQGVAMHRPDEMAYDKADSYVIDDWR